MSDLILIAALALGTWPPDQPKGNTYKLFQRYGQLDLADRLRLIRAISETNLIALNQSECDFQLEGNGHIMGGG